MVKLSLPTIMVVDDSSYNRDLLTEMLDTSFRIIQANNGAMALDILQAKRNEISCVLLDITMAIVNGFEVLEEMNKQNWLKTIPVIIISSENSPDFIRKGYTLGACDYIFRPFDATVVKRRVENIVNLYTNQKKLAKMILNQRQENERLSNMMVSILGHTVEFRNKESNAHISNVSIITKLLLEQLVILYPEYKITKEDITIISRAAALHDIGKVSIPDAILNKPGRFTDEEFEIMKKHSLIGAQILESMPEYKDEPLVKVAYKICRWHHERWDGKGYPDKLSEKNIPIEAQVVSLADVYDALTSERCYKKAFTHDEAIRMIITGECGSFNPKLIASFKELSTSLVSKIKTEQEKKNLN